MSSLEHAGVAPAKITIIGDVEKGGQARAPRGKKGAAVAAGSDRVELEIEPE